MKNGKQIQVPAEDAAYLRQHHRYQSAPEMAKALKRATVTIYAYMDALGLERKPREIDRRHPFKRQNRKLEVVFLARRIENKQRKKPNE